jgi:hypothetical protein
MRRATYASFASLDADANGEAAGEANFHPFKTSLTLNFCCLSLGHARFGLVRSEPVSDGLTSGCYPAQEERRGPRQPYPLVRESVTSFGGELLKFRRTRSENDRPGRYPAVTPATATQFPLLVK